MPGLLRARLPQDPQVFPLLWPHLLLSMLHQNMWSSFIDVYCKDVRIWSLFKGSGDTQEGTKSSVLNKSGGLEGGSWEETGIGAINRVIPWDSGTPHSLPLTGGPRRISCRLLWSSASSAGLQALPLLISSKSGNPRKYSQYYPVPSSDAPTGTTNPSIRSALPLLLQPPNLHWGLKM